MPLQNRISTRDTWAELERAGEIRFWEACALATGAEPMRTGAIYLLGYVAELIIKCAYFRLRGIAALDDVGPELRFAPRRAQAIRGGFAWKGNLHSIQEWARLLVIERRERGKPLPPPIHVSFLTVVSVIVAEWSEILRYKDTAATDNELHDMFQGVEWLRANCRRLWR